MTVNKERVELLCQALESGKYRQCTSALRQDALIGGWRYCAEGVAIDVALKNGFQLRGEDGSPILYDHEGGEFWLYSHGNLPDAVAAWYGFEDTDPVIVLDEGPGPIEVTITGANDDGNDFWTISQAIRAGYLKDEG